MHGLSLKTFNLGSTVNYTTPLYASNRKGENLRDQHRLYFIQFVGKYSKEDLLSAAALNPTDTLRME